MECRLFLIHHIFIDIISSIYSGEYGNGDYPQTVPQTLSPKKQAAKFACGKLKFGKGNKVGGIAKNAKPPLIL